MSQASRKSSRVLHRRIESVQNSERRDRAGSIASVSLRQAVVSYDDAFTYALRVAYLHYLLQPKAKRRQFVPTPKAPHRSSTIPHSLDKMLREYMPKDNKVKMHLPGSFRVALEKRMSAVITGSERERGYDDAALKRSFGEAYTGFTDKDFRRTVDRDRKIELLVLKFWTAALKAQGGLNPTNAPLVDRHVAMFLRLVTITLKNLGKDHDRPELMRVLQDMEKRLLLNDQNLVVETGDSAGRYVDVDVPLSYDVKDMAMVQVVAKIFGLSPSDVQNHVDTQVPNWTEEAALKDLKSYQRRLNSDMRGTLRPKDFASDDVYQEWKRAEAPHLTQMMMEIITARPELAKQSTEPDLGSPSGKMLPLSPISGIEEPSFSDLNWALSNADSGFGSDTMSLGSLSLDDTSSIRNVEETPYTFIPADPRAFLKTIAKYAIEFDAVHGDGGEAGPWSKQSMDLLTELCAHWRVPQFTRLVVFLEVASGRYLDSLFTSIDLDAAFELVKTAPAETKKVPYIYLWGESLATIDQNRWTVRDLEVYQRTLYSLQDALLRELYDNLMHCYEPKPPSVGPVLHVMQNHIQSDRCYSHKIGDEEAYADVLADGLQAQATNVYNDFLNKEIPQSKEDWDFAHVVQLGKSVVKLCERIKKRYRNNPEIMRVNPLTVLVETMFPKFEKDAKALIEKIIQVAQDRGQEFGFQDGFDLYKELVEIRRIHYSSLPDVPFGFDVEDLLVKFVWRWIDHAEAFTQEIINNAIDQDSFQVRGQGEGHIPLDSERHSFSVIDVFKSFNQTADQIFKLEWDKDVHHAMFMTALAKIFTNGIAKYCEMVESKFVREMDSPRVSNEEEAPATQTAQGKFIKYAKDAWNTKGQPQPFQFYAESLVKLNNIEYAMQELDKFEKLMNVDACAAVLAKAEPKKNKRPSMYVFTIKIVEAEDLKACDTSGTSDPYVVLGDEMGKRLAKTRVVMRSLNPRWDESVDITSKGALNMVATIWDYDTIGEHDFCGRTSLKLDPQHFSDYLPREFWLDLDTQGRLLLRVSMEGERDDIQFYFGKAFRHLKRTERDMVRKITDKLTSQIHATLSRDALRNLLGRNLMQSAQFIFKRQNRVPVVTKQDIENTLQPLLSYFNDNFAIMKQTLTEATMIAVMNRLWKEVLMTLEALVLPPLSEKPSTQKQLTDKELDVVFTWLDVLYNFFHAVDEDGEVMGVPEQLLKSPKYHELKSTSFFYFESTDQLIQSSERMSAATSQRAQKAMHQQTHATANTNRLLAPVAAVGAATGPSFGSMGTIRRGKSIMMSRNLGTMRQAKEEKRKEAQADPTDDVILRILRMRPEAAHYLKERHRQKERQAATAAAAMIVKQSVSQGWNSGGGGVRGNMTRRNGPG